MKKVINVFIALAAAATLSAAMVGCSQSNSSQSSVDSKNSTASEVSTQSTQEESKSESEPENSKAEESKPEESKTEECKTEVSKSEESNSEESQTEQSQSESSLADESKAEDSTADEQGDSVIHKEYWNEVYANTTRNEATILVISKVGEGWSYNSSDKSSYNDADAWYISIYNSSTDETKSAYVIGTDCYFVEEIPQNDNKQYWEEEYAGSTLDNAVSTAVSAKGEGWSYRGSEKSRYENADAWAIVLANDETGDMTIAYVKGTDCYIP